MNEFVHLHTHSERSMLDGACQIPDLVDLVEELEQPAVAITDHGWISGAIKLIKQCKDTPIKPIIGMETYIATGGSMTEPAKHAGDNYHLTLLAQNMEGYRNLVRLNSRGYMDGLSWKPRLDHEILEKYSEGIIVLSGCVGAELPHRIAYEGMESARELVDWYKDVFGDRFWIELMYHGSYDGIDHVRLTDDDGNVVLDEHELNDALIDLADESNTGIVATNDAHYLKKEHGPAHDVLLCLGTGGWIGKKNRIKFPGVEHEDWQFYMKDREQMLDAADHPRWEEACDNTLEVASTIERFDPESETILPRYQISPEQELKLRVWRETGEII